MVGVVFGLRVVSTRVLERPNRLHKAERHDSDPAQGIVQEGSKLIGGCIAYAERTHPLARMQEMHGTSRIY